MDKEKPKVYRLVKKRTITHPNGTEETVHEPTGAFFFPGRRRSERRQAKKQIQRQYGLSGRQLKRLRKQLRREKKAKRQAA